MEQQHATLSITQEKALAAAINILNTAARHGVRYLVKHGDRSWGTIAEALPETLRKRERKHNFMEMFPNYTGKIRALPVGEVLQWDVSDLDKEGHNSFHASVHSCVTRYFGGPAAFAESRFLMEKTPTLIELYRAQE